jgi:hypothetical protein
VCGAVTERMVWLVPGQKSLPLIALTAGSAGWQREGVAAIGAGHRAGCRHNAIFLREHKLRWIGLSSQSNVPWDRARLWLKGRLAYLDVLEVPWGSDFAITEPVLAARYGEIGGSRIDPPPRCRHFAPTSHLSPLTLIQTTPLSSSPATYDETARRPN